MNKLLLVAKREYLFNLKRPAFLFAAFATPLILIGIFALSIFLSLNESKSLADLNQVGYVDSAGVVEPAAEIHNDDANRLFVPYETAEAARAALDAGTLDAYFVIDPTYRQSGMVQLYGYEKPPESLSELISEWLVANLLVDTGIQFSAERLINPAELIVRVDDSGRELARDSLIGVVMFPIIFAVIFVMATQITSGFLMSGLVEEKTNRVIELLVTSVTPSELLGGKIIGLGLLGLTQLLIWLGVGLLVPIFGRDIAVLNAISIPVSLILVALAYFVLGYFMVASLMAVIGVLAGSEQESRQYAGIISLMLFIPYFFLLAFITNPNGPAPVILSMLPFTSPMGMILRMAAATVPAWQIALSLLLLLTLTVFFAWVAARIFRWALLMYGNRFSLRQIVRVLRASSAADVISRPQTKEVTA